MVSNECNTTAIWIFNVHFSISNRLKWKWNININVATSVTCTTQFPFDIYLMIHLTNEFNHRKMAYKSIYEFIIQESSKKKLVLSLKYIKNWIFSCNFLFGYNLIVQWDDKIVYLRWNDLEIMMSKIKLLKAAIKSNWFLDGFHGNWPMIFLSIHIIHCVNAASSEEITWPAISKYSNQRSLLSTAKPKPLTLFNGVVIHDFFSSPSLSLSHLCQQDVSRSIYCFAWFQTFYIKRTSISIWSSQLALQRLKNLCRSIFMWWYVAISLQKKFRWHLRHYNKNGMELLLGI